MKYLLITFLVGTLSFGNFFYTNSNKSEVVYEREGVVVYKNNNYDIMVFNPKNMSFGVSTTKPKNVNFYMNSNFFDEETIGLVVVNGRRLSDRVESGGYFYVKDGKPYVGIKYCPGYTDYASQSILWGIRKGKPNNWLIKRDHAKVKTYRNLVGKDKNGNIVVIVSNRGGMVTINDIVNEGLKMGVMDGVLFDGGSSVEYKYKDNDFSSKFKSLSTPLKRLTGVDDPTTYIYGKII